MHHNRNWLPRIISALVFAACIAIGAVALTGCASDRSFAVGKLHASADATGNTMPAVLARWDGDLFVGWSNVSAVASVEPKGGGIPFYYVSIDAGYAVVYQRTTKLKWRGKQPAVLPLAALALFTADEIARWGLSFADPGITVEPETPPGGEPPAEEPNPTGAS